MNVICINPKEYALTRDKTYTVLRQEGKYYWVENEKTSVRKYSSDLFKEVKPEPKYLTGMGYHHSLDPQTLYIRKDWDWDDLDTQGIFIVVDKNIYRLQYSLLEFYCINMDINKLIAVNSTKETKSIFIQCTSTYLRNEHRSLILDIAKGLKGKLKIYINSVVLAKTVKRYISIFECANIQTDRFLFKPYPFVPARLDDTILNADVERVTHTSVVSKEQMKSKECKIWKVL